MGPTSKKDREEIAKRAAQATETVTADEAKPAANAPAQVAPKPLEEAAPAASQNQDIDL